MSVTPVDRKCNGIQTIILDTFNKYVGFCESYFTFKKCLNFETQNMKYRNELIIVSEIILCMDEFCTKYKLIHYPELWIKIYSKKWRISRNMSILEIRLLLFLFCPIYQFWNTSAYYRYTLYKQNKIIKNIIW